MTARVLAAPKLVGEIRRYLFDFNGDLGSDTSGIGSQVCTATVYSGTDASPSSIINGAAVLSTTGVVSQSITGGVAGVIYAVVCTAVTGTPQTFVKEMLLAVVPNDP